MNWAEYVTAKMVGHTQEDVATMVGVDQSTISRWKRGKGGPPSAENAIAFARAVKDSPIKALLIVGILNAREVEGGVAMDASSADLTDEQLVYEIERRLAAQKAERRRTG